MINPDGSWTGHGYYDRGVAKIFFDFSIDILIILLYIFICH